MTILRGCEKGQQGNIYAKRLKNQTSLLRIEECN